jgi:type II secretory pathway pseudopilin PulG
MSLRAHQRGDTILEVLISVAVLSLILATSFTLTNRNTQATRQAAEHGEAYKLAQSEMEKLKLYLSEPDAEIPSEGQYFCMSDLADEIINLGGRSAGPSDVQTDPEFESQIYQRSECRAGDGDLYYLVVYRGEGAQKNTYTASVRWPGVTGNGVDKVDLMHRLYPDLSSVLEP